MAPLAAEFPAALAQTRLFPLAEAQAIHEQWLSANGGAGDWQRFLRWLVGQKHLTEYQANLLGRGHTEGYFLHEYKILERIGRGRMAGVYKAVHRLGQTVAIKVLPSSKAKDPHLLARFQRESRLALLLQHPNVVRAYHVNESDGFHYLVMEYLEGETLDEYLHRRRRLPPMEAARIVYQAMLGLQHIHEKGLVHRDLKPSNLMLALEAGGDRVENLDQVTVKILDIGLGRALYDDTPGERSDDPGLTSQGAVLGTPDYMAPEQARDPRAVDIRADIYSLGGVLYHNLTGEPPFPDTNLISQMIRHATEPTRRLREFDPTIPDALQQIVDRLLAKEVSDRFTTPERAARALQKFLGSQGDVPTPELQPQMRTYLKWLDTESGILNAAAPTAEPTPLRPASQPDLGGERRKPAPPTKLAGRATRPARTAVAPPRKHATREPNPSSASELQLPEPEAVDSASLEIQPILVRPPIPRPANWSLTRRDCIMMGIGGGGVLLAAALGWLLAQLFREPMPESGDGGRPRNAGRRS